MQRVTPALISSSTTKSPFQPLIPISTVPHAVARTDVPAEWSWNEVPVAPDTTTDVATFTPMAYESGYKYPLLVWLHGDETDERTLPDVMRHVSTRNFVAVAPRGVDCCGEGLGWDASPNSIDTAEDIVFDAIETSRARFSLHPNRVILAGSGSGGTMAMRIALRYPDRFAGVATLDGPLPTGHRPLGRVNDSRCMPLLLSACRDSTAYSEAQVCRDLALLHAAGCHVAIRQYPGDDDLTTDMLADLNRWAMKIVCG